MTARQLGDTFDQYAERLLLYARQWLPAGTAEDLVQEIFIRLAQQPEPPANLNAWLLVSVRHAALDALKLTRRRAHRDRRASEQRAPAASSFEPELADVHQLLESLPPLEREIITLRIWNEATFDDIATLLQMPLTTVYNRYRSGLEQLRSRWESPCKKTCTHP